MSISSSWWLLYTEEETFTQRCVPRFVCLFHVCFVCCPRQSWVLSWEERKHSTCLSVSVNCKLWSFTGPKSSMRRTLTLTLSVAALKVAKNEPTGGHDSTKGSMMKGDAAKMW